MVYPWQKVDKSITAYPTRRLNDAAHSHIYAACMHCALVQCDCKSSLPVLSRYSSMNCQARYSLARNTEILWYLCPSIHLPVTLTVGKSVNSEKIALFTLLSKYQPKSAKYR